MDVSLDYSDELVNVDFEEEELEKDENEEKVLDSELLELLFKWICVVDNFFVELSFLIFVDNKFLYEIFFLN